MRAVSVLILAAVGLVSTGCADFYSVSRRTTLPAHNANNGLAIHLDAQQRLMMVGPSGKYCAEASPDAMAAYAAAVAFGASAPGQGAGSAANASQSDIASIGLRTQAITLMRDALYRLCEASANGEVSDISVTQLLARSQDLTAVVVAVEQLTGATAANQVLLTGTANANAAATAIGGADQIDAANNNLERKQAARAKAQDELDAKKLAVEKQQGVVDSDNTAVGSPPEGTTEAQLQTLKDKRDADQIQLETLTREQQNLETRVSNAQAAEARAQDIVDKVTAAGEQADASASAGTTGAGEFAPNVSRVNLNNEASKDIAKSVETMVTTVLNKDYTGADCMVLLTNITTVKVDQEHSGLLDNTLRQCERLLSAKIQSEVDKLHISSFSEDAGSKRLEMALDADKTLRPKLQAWVAANFPDGSVTELIYGAEQAALRQQAINDLGVP